jgi:hypothetical protein
MIVYVHKRHLTLENTLNLVCKLNLNNFLEWKIAYTLNVLMEHFHCWDRQFVTQFEICWQYLLSFHYIPTPTYCSFVNIKIKVLFCSSFFDESLVYFYKILSNCTNYEATSYFL